LDFTKAYGKGEDSMSLDPSHEVKYGYRLALEYLRRAKTNFSYKDWVGTVLSSQLVVENFQRQL